MRNGVPSPGPVIRTVLGDIEPARAGHTQPHEHVLSDMSAIIKPWGVGHVSAAHAVADAPGGGVEPELSVTARRLAEQPVELANYDAIRREVLNLDNLRLTSEDDAIAELELYRRAGGGCVVDSSPIGMGRDPIGLARVSRSTGVHIVMGSGYYSRQYHPTGLDQVSEAAISAEIVSDLTEGAGSTEVRAGIIGEIGLSWPPHPTELKVLRAACQAQVATGAALQIHPGRDPRAPIEAMAVVEKYGADPGRTIMSHVDRTLWAPEDLTALAETGCYLELDLFGQESSYYAFNPDARRPNDRTRIEWLATLTDQGFGAKLLVSQDICQKVYLRKYGGPGYGHVLANVIPLMRRMGFTATDVRRLTVENPAAALSLERMNR
ncbi:phosphotriesterase family protein [Kribbella solani]|uniref:Phosphotriesterase-related protein n=1 Tax=Kribbella solani TaxID=236067 RepID=A0A841E3T9_9ACTN|nr:hypothetical protein [Kribbella solani]MBB5983716.1 phosphotriesterase-related protein [Kribbella solani]